MPTPRPEPDDSDPILEARVSHALAPYADLLPPEDLEALRGMTRRLLATHPVCAPLIERLRTRASPTSSGEVERRGPEVLAEAAQRLAAKASKTMSRRRRGTG
jgi:hypothetical protein